MPDPYSSPWGQALINGAITFTVSADDANASNDNPGSAALPLATLDEAIRRVNALRATPQPVVVILQPSVNPYTVSVNLQSIDLQAPLVFIGNGFTTLLNGTVDAGATNLSIPVVGGGLGVDAFFGKTLEITSGDSAGWRRMLNSNTATNLNVCHAFNLGAPAAGDTLQVVEPSVQVNFPSLTAGAAAELSELWKIQNCGQSAGNLKRNANVFNGTSAQVYFVNLKLGSINGTGSQIILQSSSLCLVGCELGDGQGNDLGPQVISDKRSLLSTGMDFFFGTARLCMPIDSGLLVGGDPRQWAGWSSFWNVTGTSPLLGCANYLGFAHCNDELRFEGSDVVLVGGRVSSTQGATRALDFSEGAYAVLEGSDAIRPLFLECDADDNESAVVMARQGASVNVKDVQITKTNQGHGILAFADDSGQGASPGNVSVGATTTITGVNDATNTTNAVRCTGGARCNILNGATIAGAWTAELAVAATPSAAPAAGSSGTLAGLAADGDAYPTVASGLTGVNGWVQRQ